MQFDEVVREGPLSFCQELLLYNELLSRVPPTVTRLVRIDGPLDVLSFTCASEAVIAAHEPLRTSWVWQQHEPVAHVKSNRNLPASTIVSDLEPEQDSVAVVAAALAPTGLAAICPPHLRHRIFRRRDSDHLWVFSGHHIAVDAISLKLYAETFRASYTRSPEVHLRTTSIEYARTQRTWLASDSAQAELLWWLRKLEPISREELPVRPPAKASDNWLERQELRLPIEVRSAVLRTARGEKSPPAAVFLAAYAQTVNRRLPRATHCVLTNVPVRNLEGATSTSGACYNSLPLVLAAEDSAAAAISTAANALFDALDQQGVPAPLINLACIRQGKPPLPDRVPVTFNVVDHPLSEFRLPGCRLWEVDLISLGPPAWGHSGPTVLRSNQTPVRPSMDWMVSLLPSSIVLTVEYNASYADREDISAILSEYEATLRRLCSALTQDVSAGDCGLVADWS
jgi:hypothetical protein